MPSFDLAIECYNSKRIFYSTKFDLFLGFETESAKKSCLRFIIFDSSEKLQNIFEKGSKLLEWSCINASQRESFLK